MALLNMKRVANSMKYKRKGKESNTKAKAMG